MASWAILLPHTVTLACAINMARVKVPSMKIKGDKVQEKSCRLLQRSYISGGYETLYTFNKHFLNHVIGLQTHVVHSTHIHTINERKKLDENRAQIPDKSMRTLYIQTKIFLNEVRNKKSGHNRILVLVSS